MTVLNPDSHDCPIKIVSGRDNAELDSKFRDLAVERTILTRINVNESYCLISYGYIPWHSSYNSVYLERIAEDDPEDKLVWIPDKENVWVLATIVSTSQDGSNLQCTVIDNSVNGGNSSSNCGNIVSIERTKTHPVDRTHLLDTNDICTINNLHEAPLLHLLQQRYSFSKIYTYTGDVLISINPYQYFDLLYDKPYNYFDFPVVRKRRISSVRRSSLSEVITFDSNSQSPHIYAIANRALAKLISNSIGHDNSKNSNETVTTGIVNQSIIISGESGSGKTEGSKHVLNFLIVANSYSESGLRRDQFVSNYIHSNSNSNCNSNSHRHDNSITDSKNQFVDRLKTLLIQSNTLLEAFGNAKTVRNNNSSRFGKYIKLMYNTENVLTTAHTATFLLERSRVVKVSKNERNYHIFYQLLHGLLNNSRTFTSNSKVNRDDTVDDSNSSVDMQDLYEYLNGNNIEDFLILTEGDCTIVHDIDYDITEYSSTLKSLQLLGCKDNEIVDIFKLLVCILHLGNINLSESIVYVNSMPTITCPSIDMEKIAQLLGLSVDLLQVKLTQQQIKVAKRASVRMKILSNDEVINNISALMKWLYQQVFNYIVHTINNAYSLNDENDSEQSQTSADKSNDFKKFIGILDIFGFEILDKNSYEQLLINYTNEKLQQQFNRYIFMKEQEIYQLEGLEWSTITYQDNQNVIDLISKKSKGLLIILEEHGMLNRKPDDMALINSYNTTHLGSSASSVAGGASTEKKSSVSTIYSRARFGNDSFVIKHFAGDVEYHINGFLAKNNDTLQEDLLELILCSSNPFLQSLIVLSRQSESSRASDDAGIASDEISKSVANRKIASAVSLSQKFRGQLEELITILEGTTPHYIKCIKPNNNKEPNEFNKKLITQQLRYSGVLESVRIRREGYPLHLSFRKFYDSYEILCRSKYFKSVNDATNDEVKEYCYYITEKFLAKDTFQIGRTQIFLRHDGTLLLQNQIIKYLNMKIVIIQSKYRSVLRRRWYIKLRKTIIVMQSLIRKYCKQRIYKYQKDSCKIMQWFIRGKMIRFRFLIHYNVIILQKRTKAVLLIQNLYIAFTQRKEYKKLLVAIRTIHKFLCSIVISKRIRARYLLQLRSIRTIQKYSRMFLLHLKKTKVIAIKLQSLARGRHARLMHLLKIRSIIKIQSYCRKYKYYKQYKQVKHIIVTLQSLHRMRKMKSLFKIMRKKIILVQSLIRRHQQINSYQRITKFIINLQSLIRMHLHKDKYCRTLKKITLVQALIRRYLLHKQYNNKKEAIIIIEMIVRGYIARMKIMKMIISIMKLQRFGRMIIQKNKFNDIVINTIILQSFVRKSIQQKKFYKSLFAITKIQSGFRKAYCSIRFKEKIHSIKILQSFGRMIIAKNNYNTVIISVITIQSVVRSYQQQCNYKKQRKILIRLQNYYRMRIKTKKYKKQRDNIILIQKTYRKTHQKYWYQLLKKSVNRLKVKFKLYLDKKQIIRRFFLLIRLQSLIRRKLSRKQYLYRRTKVIELQSYGRMIIHQKRYSHYLYCIVLIQSIIRIFLSKITTKKLKRLITFLQSYQRMRKCYNNYIKLRNSVTTLKAKFRSLKVKQSYQIILLKIIKLQSFIRTTMLIKRFIYIKKCIVKLQSITRMCLCKNLLKMTYKFIIRIQSSIRRFLILKNFKKVKKSANKIKSVYKMFVTRRNYKKQLKLIMNIQLIARRKFNNFKMRRRLLFIHQTCRKVKISLTFNQETKLSEVTKTVGNAINEDTVSLIAPTTVTICDRNSNEKILSDSRDSNVSLYRIKVGGFDLSVLCRMEQLHALKELDKRFPTDKFTRCKQYSYSTIIQSALFGGDERIVKFYDVKVADLFDFDINKNNSFDYLCHSMNILLLYYVVKIIDEYDYESNDELVAFDYDMSSSFDHLGNSNSVNTSINSKVPNIDRINSNLNMKNSGIFPSDASSVNDNVSIDDDYLSSVAIQLQDEIVNSKLKDGWIKKKKGGLSITKKKFAILTEDHFIYYNDADSLSKPRFAMPLPGCTVQRGSGRDSIIEIIPSQIPTIQPKTSFFTSSSAKKQKTFTFILESEKELQEWLIPLKAAAGVPSLQNSNLHYSNYDLRKLWLSNINKDGNSAMHNLMSIIHKKLSSGAVGNQRIGSLVLTEDTDTQLSEYVIESIKFIVWAIENGYDINTQNMKGETVLHLAIKYSLPLEIIRCLLVKGASAIIRDETGATVIELVNQSRDNTISDLIRKCTIRNNNGKPMSTLSSVLRNKMKGYSYLSMYFRGNLLPINDRLVLSPTQLIYALLTNHFYSRFSSLEDPVLSVSLYNAKKHILEEPQLLELPVLHQNNNNNLYWGQTWHMHTPLENLETGSFIIIQLINRTSTASSATMSKAASQRTMQNFMSVESTTLKSNSESTKVPNNANQHRVDGVGEGVAWLSYRIRQDEITSSNDVQLTLSGYPIFILETTPSKGKEIKVNNCKLSFDIIVHRKNRVIEYSTVLKA